MCEILVQQLEDYRSDAGLTNVQLAQQLEIPETYLYRWRKRNNINGIYEKYVRLFLEQQEMAVK